MYFLNGELFKKMSSWCNFDESGKGYYTVLQTMLLSWAEPCLLATKCLSLRSKIDFLLTHLDGDSIVDSFQKCDKKSRAYKQFSTIKKLMKWKSRQISVYTIIILFNRRLICMISGLGQSKLISSSDHVPPNWEVTMFRQIENWPCSTRFHQTEKWPCSTKLRNDHVPPNWKTQKTQTFSIRWNTVISQFGGTHSFSQFGGPLLFLNLVEHSHNPFMLILRQGGLWMSPCWHAQQLNVCLFCRHDVKEQGSSMSRVVRCNMRIIIIFSVRVINWTKRETFLCS